MTIEETEGQHKSCSTLNTRTLFQIKSHPMLIRTFSVLFEKQLSEGLNVSKWTAFIQNDQVAHVAVNLQGVAEISETDYNFIIAEAEAEASIRILSGKISYEFYIPIYNCKNPQNAHHLSNNSNLLLGDTNGK